MKCWRPRLVWGRVFDPSRPSKALQVFRRWLKFNCVGGIGIAVQLAALAILRSLLHLDYLVATTLAVEITILHNFIWHERFTWAEPVPKLAHSLRRFVRFNASNGLVSITGNVLVMKLLHGELGINYFVANLVAIASCSLANFLLSECFVFAPRAARD